MPTPSEFYYGGVVDALLPLEKDARTRRSFLGDAGALIGGWWDDLTAKKPTAGMSAEGQKAYAESQAWAKKTMADRAARTKTDWGSVIGKNVDNVGDYLADVGKIPIIGQVAGLAGAGIRGARGVQHGDMGEIGGAAAEGVLSYFNSAKGLGSLYSGAKGLLPGVASNAGRAAAWGKGILGVGAKKALPAVVNAAKSVGSWAVKNPGTVLKTVGNTALTAYSFSGLFSGGAKGMQQAGAGMGFGNMSYPQFKNIAPTPDFSMMNTGSSVMKSMPPMGGQPAPAFGG